MPNTTTSEARATERLKAQQPHLHMALKLIEQRRKHADQQRDDAVREQRWSQVAGFDGIGTGLLLAEKIVREEMQALERQLQAAGNSKTN